MIKAKKYKIRVSDGDLAISHGWTNEIEEIYIPSKKLIINEKCIFKENGRRIKVGKDIKYIELEEVVVDAAIEEIKLREEADKYRDSIINKIF